MKSEVSIKIKLENKLEIMDTGYLQADYLLKQLIENEHITKKCDNVMLRLDNLLYDNNEIDSAYLDLENECVILTLKSNNYLKDCFIKYEKVRRSGKYNMITMSEYAAREADLSINEYLSVQRNYSTLYKKYKNEI